MSKLLSPDPSSSRLEDLRKEAREALLRTPYLALRSVEVELREDVMVLKGRLPSYFLKQVAQTCLGRLLAEHRIINEIEVPAADADEQSNPHGRQRRSRTSPVN